MQRGNVINAVKKTATASLTIGKGAQAVEAAWQPVRQGTEKLGTAEGSSDRATTSQKEDVVSEEALSAKKSRVLGRNCDPHKI